MQASAIGAPSVRAHQTGIPSVAWKSFEDRIDVNVKEVNVASCLLYALTRFANRSCSLTEITDVR